MGSLSVTSGGSVTTAGSVVLGSLAAGTGKLVVSGTGSSMRITGALSLASAGNGALTVESDGELFVTGALTMGNPAGAPVGELNFDGGTITAGSFTRAAGAKFNWANGTLLVNGGTFNNAGESLTINGSGLNDLPALRLSAGAQSTAASVPVLTIGSSRKGALIVSGGSVVQLTSASVGSLDGGSGTLVVEGFQSSFLTAADLNVGGTTTAGGGLGSITLGPGGTVTAGGALRLWSGASVTVSGGTLKFTNLDTKGGRLTFNSGTVQTLGAFNGNSATLDAIVGSTRVLGFGRKIDSQSNAFNLQSDLNITGGAVSGSVLTVSPGVVARFEAAGTGTFTSVTNPSGARIYVSDATLSASATFTNSGEVHLSGEAATISGGSFTNTGLLSGNGRVNAPITNNTAGQVRVTAGRRLEILGASGTNVNNGLIDVDGGTIEFSRVVTNSSSNPSSGLIAARDATLRFEAGLANSGALTFSSGVSDVFGNVTNLSNLSTPGRIVVTGGAQANFFDDVVNNGSIQVSGAGSLQSTAVFLGSLSGNGVSGGGHVFIEGDARPGFSPGTMSFGGDVSFGPLSTLNIELAGTNPGTQYDRVVVADSAAISGDLDVTLLDGYRPTIGSSFQILSAAGGLSGTFDAESLPALAGGASWSVQYGAAAVTLEVGGVLGDFNHDGRVDAADYTVWRDQAGTNALASDASGNGSVDQADYNIWKANFGKVAMSGAAAQNPTAAAVPEPTSIALLAIIGACVSLAPRRRS
jgi:T5SS/PEP-CTERM-associated repeat protein